MNTKLLVKSTKAVTTVKSKLARLVLLALFIVLISACGGGESNEFDEGSGDPGKPEQSVEENSEPGIVPNDESVNPPSTLGTVTPSSTAAALYEEQCSACHGEDGKGGFVGGELYQCDVCGNEQSLYTTILNTMPLGNPASCGAECSQALATYIFNDFGESQTPPVEPTPVMQPPVASASGTVLFGNRFRFNGETSSDIDGAIVSYMWNFGDGTSAVGAVAQHTFSASGTYTVVLTVTDNHNLTGSAQLVVTVGGSPGVTPVPMPSPTPSPTPPTPSPTVVPLPTVVPTPSATPIPTGTPSPTPTSTPAMGAAAIFNNGNGVIACATCHGTDAATVVGNNRIIKGSSYTRDALQSKVNLMLQTYFDSNCGSGLTLNQCGTQLTDYIFANFANEVTGNSVDGFSCQNDAPLPYTVPLKRLTKIQYRNTVRDLLDYAAADDADAVYALVESLVELYPDDKKYSPPHVEGRGLSRLDQVVGDGHVSAAMNTALEIGALLTADSSIISRVFGQCAVDGNTSNDQTCLDTFIRNFGERALRKSLSTAEISHYKVYINSMPTQPQNLANLIAAFLTAPHFLYHVENTGQNVNAQGLYPLSAYELANRLSYHFWNTMPDETLLATARNGSLSNNTTYEAQVDRLIADPRSKDGLSRFYREWLWIDGLPELTFYLGQERFDRFLDGQSISNRTHINMQNEVIDMIDYYVKNNGTFSDLLHSPYSFAKTQDVASIYGVPVWSGSGTPPKFPAAQAREGILARAALLSSASGITRPIMKGVFIKRGFLCGSIGHPPPNIDTSAATVVDDRQITTRERIEQLTEAPGTDCRGCHAQLNPMGFATENFDALGRARTMERVFYEVDDELGEVSLPVDTLTSAYINNDFNGAVSNVTELNQLIEDSKAAQQCFVRTYFRYTFYRGEQTGTDRDNDGQSDDRNNSDGCLAEAVFNAMEGDGTLRDALKQMVMRPEFKANSALY